ncbi:hypothetical protein JAAARDRAFT_136189 [Jaapia argillacea MUCL 33604]|uniref:Uncharacterized protein n=1 Tax=Jaapia argillacea MUCL 33604 TaxID=933084 RepID=A0A067PUH1_9AGAM|nr:hypothetical protein JAAARDRAFT_136189 [Jaapia argillacea MUCL 33604]
MNLVSEKYFSWSIVANLVSAHLKATWRSPVYAFFKPKVTIEYHNGHLCHFFPCTACKCKNPLKGTHAITCFGAEEVEAAMKGQKATTHNGSIFAVFAWQGQQPVTVSHCTHTNAEVRAHFVKWLTESNRPANIVSDREFHKLMTTGRPSLSLPSLTTISQDIHLSFEKCHNCIKQLLNVSPAIFFHLHPTYRTL